MKKPNLITVSINDDFQIKELMSEVHKAAAAVFRLRGAPLSDKVDILQDNNSMLSIVADVKDNYYKIAVPIHPDGHLDMPYAVIGDKENVGVLSHYMLKADNESFLSAKSRIYVGLNRAYELWSSANQIGE